MRNERVYIGPFKVRPEDREAIVAGMAKHGMSMVEYVVFMCVGRPPFDEKNVLPELQERLAAEDRGHERVERMAGLGGFE